MGLLQWGLFLRGRLLAAGMWVPVVAIAWPLGFSVTWAIGVDVERGYYVFGARVRWSSRLSPAWLCCSCFEVEPASQERGIRSKQPSSAGKTQMPDNGEPSLSGEAPVYSSWYGPLVSIVRGARSLLPRHREGKVMTTRTPRNLATCLCRTCRTPLTARSGNRSLQPTICPLHSYCARRCHSNRQQYNGFWVAIPSGYCWRLTRLFD